MFQKFHIKKCSTLINFLNSTQKRFLSHEFPKSPKKNQRNKRYENIYKKIHKFHTKNCSALIKILRSTQKHFWWREFPKIIKKSIYESHKWHKIRFSKNKKQSKTLIEIFFRICAPR